MEKNLIRVECRVCGNKFYLEPRVFRRAMPVAECTTCNAIRRVKVLDRGERVVRLGDFFKALYEHYVAIPPKQMLHFVIGLYGIVFGFSIALVSLRRSTFLLRIGFLIIIIGAIIAVESLKR